MYHQTSYYTSQPKRTRLSQSWYHLFYATILRIVIGVGLVILAGLKTVDLFIADKVTILNVLILIGTWIIAVLNVAASIFAYLGVIEDPNL